MCPWLRTLGVLFHRTLTCSLCFAICHPTEKKFYTQALSVIQFLWQRALCAWAYEKWTRNIRAIPRTSHIATTSCQISSRSFPMKYTQLIWSFCPLTSLCSKERPLCSKWVRETLPGSGYLNIVIQSTGESCKLHICAMLHPLFWAYWS